MTGDTQSPVIRFRVDSEVQDILNETKAKNISEFIRNKIKSIDTAILKALFPYFAIQGIKTQEGDLTPEMMARLIEISKEPSIKVKIGELRRLNGNVL